MACGNPIDLEKWRKELISITIQSVINYRQQEIEQKILLNERLDKIRRSYQNN